MVNCISLALRGTSALLVSGLVLTFSAGSAFAGPIYVVHEADGVIRFTSRRPSEGVSAKVFTAKNASFSTFRMGPYRGVSNASVQKLSQQYQDIIADSAKEHDVDPSLIRAVIHAESAFNPHAVSPKGAQGLMQLMPGTARDMGVRRPFAANDNIRGGVQYLARLIKRFPGNLSHAIAAYNAGEENVNRFQGIPPFRETQDYVRRVLALKARYSLHSRTAEG